MRRLPALCVVLLIVTSALSASSQAEQATQPAVSAAGKLDSGGNHTCAGLVSGGVRCWGSGTHGQLGYGSRNTIGDDESPFEAGPVGLGPGRTAKALSAGDYHTCALLDDGTVRCWGFGGNGRLGYGNQVTVDDPAAVEPVNLGPKRTAKAISAGAGHTCALLDNGSVDCWGYGGNGRLGYNSTNDVGDNETPASVGPLDLGAGRTAKAISAGAGHTCAVLDDNTVRCWGFARDGRLGYGNTNNNVGDTETPESVGPVDLGAGRTAKAISAGGSSTCAVLDDDTVRCWGYGGNGRLGYVDTNAIGDNETPGSVGPVDLGPRRTANAISAADDHACALLDDHTVRCWGYGGNGRLGYGDADDIGDDETPASVGPVDLGLGRTGKAISAGGRHTCALLDDDTVRCWGYGGNGRLGYCNPSDIGDDEAPGSAGPVGLETPGFGCPSSSAGGSGDGDSGGDGSGGGGSGGGASGGESQLDGGGRAADPRRLEKLRARQLRSCLAQAKRQEGSKTSRSRRSCLKRYGRTPGPITGLRARVVSETRIMLSFSASGTDGSQPPAARAYLVKQSLRPIRGPRDFARAQTLCSARCRFKVTSVATKLNLTINDLRPRTAYYYALAARDNVSGRLGQRSRTVSARTR